MESYYLIIITVSAVSSVYLLYNHLMNIIEKLRCELIKVYTRDITNSYSELREEARKEKEISRNSFKSLHVKFDALKSEQADLKKKKLEPVIAKLKQK